MVAEGEMVSTCAVSGGVGGVLTAPGGRGEIDHANERSACSSWVAAALPSVSSISTMRRGLRAVAGCGGVGWCPSDPGRSVALGAALMIVGVAGSKRDIPG